MNRTDSESIMLMKKIVNLLFSGALILGAYFFTFGVPAPVANLLSGTPEPIEKPSGQKTNERKSSRGRGGATTVVVRPLVHRPYVDILHAIGSSVAQHSVDVVAGVSGTVTETRIVPNNEVAAGEELIKLDDSVEVLNLEIAQAELYQTQQAVKRYESLSNGADITAVELENARVASRLAAAKVGLAKVALENRTVFAPISGRVSLTDVDIGDRVNSEQVIVTIDDANTLLIEFELPERSISLLSGERSILANSPVFVGRTFEGEIIANDSRLDSVTRSVTVRARIENPDRLLWPGMTFTVRLINETEKLPVVPATAITWSRDGSAIWVDTNGAASRVPVTILYRSGDHVWIDAEISEGTSIVTEGAQKLREGGALRVEGAARSNSEKSS